MFRSCSSPCLFGSQPNSMATILAIRHAPVASTGICYGQIDQPVLKAPSESIEWVRSQLEGYPQPSSVWSSPLQRCRQLAEQFGEPYSLCPQIVELSFGLWEGLSWTEIHQQYPEAMAAWGEDWLNIAPPGGESALQLQARVQSWRTHLDDGVHLAFTHAGVIRALRVLCNGLSWPAAMSKPVIHLSVESFSFPT